MNEFKLEEIVSATDNFCPSRVIGKGSHGCIYRGILEDGQFVAIKKQSSGLQKLQDNTKLENEACILSSLSHNPYLIRLLGTSHDSFKNKLLVMEHMPKGTLHEFLHLEDDETTLNWSQRFKTAVQIAKALQFLHEENPTIVHRDIKSANVLFDQNLNAKLADFGLAIRMDGYDSLSRPAAGTIGYLDPCYTVPSKLSTKVDVFSYGVLLFEIISGRKAIDVSKKPAAIVEWATALIQQGRVLEICDERIELPHHVEDTIKNLAFIASRCVSLMENLRPSMAEIVIQLEKSIIDEQSVVRFPLWTSFLCGFALQRWQRKLGCKTDSTQINNKGNGRGVTISKGALLVREILAEIT
ncbi:Serine/threonine-protein kinase-like protein [Forsythia ovata]|uniref:Serine/threonine-protein kinase-like protein n=1 Tax=Forsythia ovata TaxID=205694 RepID=A0ABD1VHZ6_9LAMI